MNLIKSIIVIMSLLIFVCLGLVVYGISKTKSTKTADIPSGETRISSITLPHDAIIEKTITAGDQLALQVTIGEKTSYYFIDSKTGQHLATTHFLQKENDVAAVKTP